MRSLLTAFLILIVFMGINLLTLVQSGEETEALNTIGDDALIKKDVFDPGGRGAKPKPGKPGQKGSGPKTGTQSVMKLSS